MNPSPSSDGFPAVQFPSAVLVEITADIHICGLCKQQFNNLDAFVAHKQSGCQLADTTGAAGAVQFVPGENEPPTSTRTNTSETQTISEFVYEHGYQSFLPNESSGVSAAPKYRSKKNSASVPQRKHCCTFPGCQFKTAYGMKDMERHFRTHTGDKPHKCETCGKRFSRKDKLKTHMRSHTGEKPYKCKECDYCAADSSSLCKHQRIHTNERPFKCQICPYASRNSSQLTVHLRSHTGDAPFQCILCSAKFKINSDLKRHMRVHTGEKPYRCEFCDFFCAMKGNLKSHIKMKHNADTTFKCSECDFQCGSKADLRQHLRSHLPEQPVKCSECTYSCSNRAALKVHERIHSKDRPFKCSFCRFDTKQRSNLTTHVKKCHADMVNSGKAALSNTEGDMLLPIPRKYNSQKNDKVEAKKAYKCDLCDASFVREDSLRSHKKQHNEFIIQKTPEMSMLQLQMEAARQDNHLDGVPDKSPDAVAFGETIKIIIGSEGSEEDNEDETMADTESSDVIKNIQNHIASKQLNMLRHVNLMASPKARLSRARAQQIILPASPDRSGSVEIREEVIPNGDADNHESFVSNPSVNGSDLESLNDLIQEETTEVTVVIGEDDVSVSGSSSQLSPAFSSSPQDEESKQDYGVHGETDSEVLCPADSIDD
ncbi:zinc finger protein 64 [Spea bombifrons]|uniref:zinc finger protein 64 n=1 Tax=Spea bombifrons TaxID=233779 RepID=UPI00234A2A10|nr:zinc finger protein 64 [Spea bombifrons]